MSDKKVPTSNLLFIICLLFIIATFFLLFLGPEFVKSRLKDWNISTENQGQIGDIFGGTLGPFIAMIAAILTFAAFWVQYKANLAQKEQFNEQTKNFAIERFESKFFELIKFHRDNVSEMSFDGSRLKEDEDSLFVENKMYQGKSVFNVIFNQFIICRNELKPFFRKDKIFHHEYEQQLLKEPFIIKNKINIRTLALIDVCYCIVFYGLSSQGLQILENLFKKKYKEKFVFNILRFMSLKPANDEEILKKWKVLSNRNTRGKRNTLVEQVYEWRKNKTIPLEYYSVVENYHNRYIKYYGGHQFRLGHYYRHLFQTVKYVNTQVSINYSIKYEYIKTLRAQLSTYEQAVLFLNCLSKIGEQWEVKPDINIESNHFKLQDFELITKYNLIKNIPGDSLYGIHFKDFFPLIIYEGDDTLKNRPKYC